MKYIKKDEYKNTPHILKDAEGRQFKIKSDIIDNDEIYNRYSHMFDIVEEKEIVKEKVEEKQLEKTEEENNLEELIQEELDENVEFVEDLKEVVEKTVLEQLEELETVEEIHKLAEENNVNIDKRKRNIDKIKEEFVKEYDV